MADPVSRIMHLDAFRDRLMAMHKRVGLVFFMPETRDRFRDKLFRKWLKVGQERQMLMDVVRRYPQLNAEYKRRMAERAVSEQPSSPKPEPDPPSRGSLLARLFPPGAPGLQPEPGRVPNPTEAELVAHLGSERAKKKRMELKI